MTSRVLVPEILDQLDHDDPDALRSRADLRRINRVLGNFRWLRRALETLGAGDGSLRVVEIGAGDGHFIREFARTHPNVRYTAIDLAPRPENWPENLGWRQGCALEHLDGAEGDVLVANLFLHHLNDEQLTRLGAALRGYRAVICNEPARFRAFHVLGRALQLLGVNYVTLYDMHASINAGFRHRELPSVLGLEQPDWRVQASHSPLGFFRMIATRPE